MGRSKKKKKGNGAVKRTPEEQAVLDETVTKLVQSMNGVAIAPVALADMEKPVTWVLGGNGIFQLRKTPVGVVVARVGSSRCTGLPTQPEHFQMDLPKMPWETFRSMVAFLGAAWYQNHAEALIRAYYHVEAGWRLHVPNQEVSVASVDVSAREEDPGLGLWAMEVHCHPGSSSKFSGVDDRDDVHQRIYGCIADFDGDQINSHWRVGTGAEVWQNIQLADVVEMPTGEVTLSVPWDSVMKGCMVDPYYGAEFPGEWLDKLTKPHYRYSGGRNWIPGMSRDETVHSTTPSVKGPYQPPGNYFGGQRVDKPDDEGQGAIIVDLEDGLDKDGFVVEDEQTLDLVEMLERRHGVQR